MRNAKDHFKAQLLSNMNQRENAREKRHEFPNQKGLECHAHDTKMMTR